MSGATGKSEKGKTLASAPSKTHPTPAPPPLFQTSLLPVVSKADIHRSVDLLGRRLHQLPARPLERLCHQH